MRRILFAYDFDSSVDKTVKKMSIESTTIQSVKAGSKGESLRLSLNRLDMRDGGVLFNQ